MKEKILQSYQHCQLDLYDNYNAMLEEQLFQVAPTSKEKEETSNVADIHSMSYVKMGKTIKEGIDNYIILQSSTINQANLKSAVSSNLVSVHLKKIVKERC